MAQTSNELCGEIKQEEVQQLTLVVHHILQEVLRMDSRGRYCGLQKDKLQLSSEEGSMWEPANNKTEQSQKCSNNAIWILNNENSNLKIKLADWQAGGQTDTQIVLWQCCALLGPAVESLEKQPTFEIFLTVCRFQPTAPSSYTANPNPNPDPYPSSELHCAKTENSLDFSLTI